MTAEERKAMFRQSAEARARERVDEAEGKKNRNFDRYEVEWTAFTVSPTKLGGRVVRLLGTPLKFRSAPTDPKVVATSWVVGSNGKKWPFVWPIEGPEGKVPKDFIMKKFIDKVLEGKWIAGSDQKEYYHVGTPIFTAVHKNNNPENQYEGGWYPGKSFLINCIDRARMDWHREKKQTLVLSKNYKPSSDPAKPGFFDVGVSQVLYKRLLDDVIEYAADGDWEEFDVVLRRSAVEPYYWAFHGIDDSKKLSDAEKSLVHVGPLTAEELSWDRWDFDKAYEVTPLKRWYDHVGNFVKMGDAQFGTTFFEELQHLVNVEAEQKAKDDAEKAKIQITVPADTPKASLSPQASANPDPAPAQEPAPTPAPTATVRTRAVAINWQGLADGTFNGKKYEGVEKMSEEEKSMVTGVNADGSFSYLPSWKGAPVVLWGYGPLLFQSPEQFRFDPLTGDALPPPSAE